MSSPLEATSVASSTDRDLDLNLFSAPRRLFWKQRISRSGLVSKGTTAFAASIQISVKLYLTHLSVQRDGGDAEVPQQQRHPLGAVTRAAEDYEGVTSQLVQDGHQVTVLKVKHTRPSELQ